MTMSKKTSKSMQHKEIKPAQGRLPIPPGMPNLPPEMEKKLKVIKEKLDKFKDKVLEKFGDYIVGIALLPPEKPKQGELKEGEKKQEKKKGDQNNIHVLVGFSYTASLTIPSFGVPVGRRA